MICKLLGIVSVTVTAVAAAPELVTCRFQLNWSPTKNEPVSGVFSSFRFGQRLNAPSA